MGDVLEIREIDADEPLYRFVLHLQDAGWDVIFEVIFNVESGMGFVRRVED